MYYNTITHEVNPKTLLDKIFLNGLPVNSFINKGRCAIGATYGEIINKTRCTIITVPNISILLNKKDSHPELNVVYGNVTDSEIKAMIRKSEVGQKIMTTPEGLRRIIVVATELCRIEEIYREWFLLLDEAHTFISEEYRENILTTLQMKGLNNLSITILLLPKSLER